MRLASHDSDSGKHFRLALCNNRQNLMPLKILSFLVNQMLRHMRMMIAMENALCG